MLEAYEAPFIVKFFHRTPRFGHPNDIGTIFSEESSVREYGLGLIFLPVTLCSIFLLWNILLIVFKCFCRNNIIGGAHLKNDERYRVRNTFYRSGVVLSTISIVVLAVMSYIQLSGDLNESFQSIQNAIDDLKSIVEKLSSTADAIEDAQSYFEDNRIILIFELENGICKDESIVTPIDEDIDDIVKGMIAMGDWSNKYEFSLGQVQNALVIAEQRLSHEIFNIVNIVQDYSAVAWIMVTMLIFASIILVGSWFAWFGPRLRSISCFMGRLVLPLFMMTLSFSVFLACLDGITIIFNSDVCIGSVGGNPEGLFKTIVSYQELDNNPKDLLDYYIFNSCNGNVSIIDNIKSQLNETLSFHNQIKSSLDILTQEKQRQIELLCNNKVSLDETVTSLKQLMNTSLTLIPLAQNAQDAVDCHAVNELYRNLSHDVICTQIPITIGWIFWSVVSFVIFGMIVYTLRGALFPSIKIVNDERKELNLEELNGNEMAYVNNEGDVIIPLTENDEENDTSQKSNSKTGHENRALMMLELEHTFSNSTEESSPKYYATI